MAHISQKQNLNLNELDVFLKTDRAPALNDILNWWKVSFKIKFLKFLKILNLKQLFLYNSDMQMNFHR